MKHELDKKSPPRCVEDEMKTASGSPIIYVAGLGISPVILLIGLYVLFHGHYSPGGGFQGGVLMAAGILLLRLTMGAHASQTIFPSRIASGLSAAGVLIFAGTGLIALLWGGNFLDYHSLPLPRLDPVHLRYYGILFIEVGVTVTVMTTLIAIYDDILGC